MIPKYSSTMSSRLPRSWSSDDLNWRSPNYHRFIIHTFKLFLTTWPDDIVHQRCTLPSAAVIYHHVSIEAKALLTGHGLYGKPSILNVQRLPGTCQFFSVHPPSLSPLRLDKTRKSFLLFSLARIFPCALSFSRLSSPVPFILIVFPLRVN